jgi:hypothetical protein
MHHALTINIKLMENSNNVITTVILNFRKGDVLILIS